MDFDKKIGSFVANYSFQIDREKLQAIIDELNEKFVLDETERLDVLAESESEAEAYFRGYEVYSVEKICSRETYKSVDGETINTYRCVVGKKKYSKLGVLLQLLLDTDQLSAEKEEDARYYREDKERMAKVFELVMHYQPSTDNGFDCGELDKIYERAKKCIKYEIGTVKKEKPEQLDVTNPAASLYDRFNGDNDEMAEIIDGIIEKLVNVGTTRGSK